MALVPQEIEDRIAALEEKVALLEEALAPCEEPTIHDSFPSEPE